MTAPRQAGLAPPPDPLPPAEQVQNHVRRSESPQGTRQSVSTRLRTPTPYPFAGHSAAERRSPMHRNACRLREESQGEGRLPRGAGGLWPPAPLGNLPSPRTGLGLSARRTAERGKGVRLEVPCAVRAWRASSACLTCPEPVHPLDTRGIDVVFSSGCRRVWKTPIEGEEGVSMAAWAPPTPP